MAERARLIDEASSEQAKRVEIYETEREARAEEFNEKRARLAEAEKRLEQADAALAAKIAKRAGERRFMLEVQAPKAGGMGILLGISPPELEFEREPPPNIARRSITVLQRRVSAVQLNKTLTAALRLKNDSDVNVAYKVMTTAPKRYCVRPNAGVLGPKETITVEGSRRDASREPWLAYP